MSVGQMFIQRKNESRTHYIMRVAAEYIREFCPDETIGYDDAECDGYCLADDLDIQREEGGGLTCHA